MSGPVSVVVRGAVVCAAMAVGAVATPATAHADTCVDSGTGRPLALEAPPCADVLAQEARWLTAITIGDVATVESILGPTFRHVNADGEAFDRAQEIAAMEPLDSWHHHRDAGRRGGGPRAVHRRLPVAERRMEGADRPGDRGGLVRKFADSTIETDLAG